MRQKASSLSALLRHTALSMAALWCFALSAHAQSNRVIDSLRRIYLSVTPAGDKLIVDQGDWKAIFSAAGTPVTPFAFRELMPGLDGHFIGNTNHGYQLLDAAGNTVAIFNGPVTRVDSALHQYVSKNTEHSIVWYDTMGHEIESAYLEPRDYDNGFYRVSSYDNGITLQGIKDTAGYIILPQVFTGTVSLGSRGIVAMKRDTAFVYNRAGALRFSSKADDARMLPHGIVALKRYGLWGLRDSTGKAITPFKYYRIEEHQSDHFIHADNTILDKTGRERATASNSYVFVQPGNWLEQNGEIRDDDFNVVFKANEFERSDFIGSRFIRLYKDYNDRTAQIYDRKYRRFTNYLVESALTDDAYVVYIPQTMERKVLKGDKLLKLPRFTEVKPVEHFPFFILTDEGKAARGFMQERERNDDRGSIAIRKITRAESYGLLDTGMRLIVPFHAASIQVLGTKLIYAYQPKDTAGYLYSDRGKVLLKMHGAPDVRREQSFIRLSSADGVAFTDTLGHIFFRGGEQPALLYPIATAEYQHNLPVLLLYDDESGYSGLYDLNGRQLLPHRYYGVAQKVPGLFSLKKGDSIYFANTQGRLLYDGRGFAGRNYMMLEGYGVLMQDAHRHWGVLGADGKALQPFIYDSIIKLQYLNEPPQYGLAKGGQFTLIDNAGRLRYPLQPWKPVQYLADDYYLGSDSISYQIQDGQVAAIPPDQYWPRSVARSRYSGWEHFKTYGPGSVVQPGIYNRNMKLLAPWYKDFSYQTFQEKMVITDSGRLHVAVIDTAGNRLVPFIRRPAVILVSDSAVTALYRDGYDLLFHRQGTRYERKEITVDSAIRARYLKESAGMQATNGAVFPFVTREGAHGVVSYRGGLLLDPGIKSIYQDDYGWRVRTATGKWGLLDPNTLQYIQFPDADSISTNRQQRDFFIFRQGLQGLYHGDTRTYLPPLYERIFNTASLQNNFIVVKAKEGYAILDKDGRRVTPFLDSVATDVWSITNMAARYRGGPVSLSIADDGTIRIDEGLSARIKRTGNSGYFYTTVVVQSGDRQGLYSNEAFRMVVPAVYDAIELRNEHGFIIWKYKEDKHQGVDSTLIANMKGRVFCALKGGFSPEEKDGYWYISGEGLSPVYSLDGELIIPAGYNTGKLIRNSFFIVRKEGKAGTISDAGKWIIPKTLDDIEHSDYDESEYHIGSIDRHSKDKYCLIGSQGDLLTKPIYDEIKLTGSDILFRRGAIYGYLDAKGKETIRKWPDGEMNDD